MRKRTKTLRKLKSKIIVTREQNMIFFDDWAKRFSVILKYPYISQYEYDPV